MSNEYMKKADQFFKAAVEDRKSKEFEVKIDEDSSMMTMKTLKIMQKVVP